MPEGPFFSQIRSHVVLELPLYVREWSQYVRWLEASDGTAEESLLARVAGLAQLTRGLVRLLDMPQAEVFAVELESMLTHAIVGSLQYTRTVHLSVVQGCRCLEQVLCAVLDPDMSDDTHISLCHGLLRDAHTLRRAVGVKWQSAYGGVCVAFPVQQRCLQDVAPLRLRGFDLLRVEWEGLFVYLAEFPWAEVVGRGMGVGGLMASLARSGHVFDVRPCPLEPCMDGGVLRIVYASALAQDFAQALLRSDSVRLYPVSLLHVRRYQPSWERPHTPIMARAVPGAGRSMDALLDAYDEALTELFRTAKAPRPFVPYESDV